MTEKQQQDTPFNMAMIFYMRLNDLLAKKDEAAIINDVVTWYRSLKSIYKNIIFKVDKGDRKILDQKFKDLAEYIYLPAISNKALEEQRDLNCIQEANKILDFIDKKLMIIMDKKKMIFPDLKLSGGLADIRQRLKL